MLKDLENAIGAASADHQRVLLLKYLLDPEIPLSGRFERIRSKPTDFKTLVAMYQLNKNVLNGKWKRFCCSKDLIAEVAGVSRKAVTRFVCGEGRLFFQKQERFGRTNIYRLEGWVVEMFRFFETKGLMKGFMDASEKWRVAFLKRLRVWLLPLLEAGHSIKSILMNKLSTKSGLKGAGSPTLKGASIKPSTKGHKALYGSKSNIERDPLPVENRFSTVASRLIRFGIENGEVNALMGSYSLNHHRKASDLYELYKQRGIEPRIEARLYQSCLNETKPRRQMR